MSEIKITDRRMFTPDGELREGFEDLDVDPPADAASSAAGPEAPAVEPEAPAEPAPPAEPTAAPEAAGHVDVPLEPSPHGSPGFLDLVAMLAEPVAIYLGDAPLPTGETAENLDLARMHIDLLDVLRQKSSGNLTAQEMTILDDLLYRLRMRYVQKRG